MTKLVERAGDRRRRCSPSTGSTSRRPRSRWAPAARARRWPSARKRTARSTRAISRAPMVFAVDPDARRRSEEAGRRLSQQGPLRVPQLQRRRACGSCAAPTPTSSRRSPARGENAADKWQRVAAGGAATDVDAAKMDDLLSSSRACAPSRSAPTLDKTGLDKPALVVRRATTRASSSACASASRRRRVCRARRRSRGGQARGARLRRDDQALDAVAGAAARAAAPTPARLRRRRSDSCAVGVSAGIWRQSATDASLAAYNWPDAARSSLPFSRCARCRRARRATDAAAPPHAAAPSARCRAAPARARARSSPPRRRARALGRSTSSRCATGKTLYSQNAAAVHGARLEPEAADDGRRRRAARLGLPLHDAPAGHRADRRRRHARRRSRHRRQRRSDHQPAPSGALGRVRSTGPQRSGARASASSAGNVVGDDNAFAEPGWGVGWAWDNLQYGYGAPVGALQYNENQIEVHRRSRHERRRAPPSSARRRSAAASSSSTRSTTVAADAATTGRHRARARHAVPPRARADRRGRQAGHRARRRPQSDASSTSTRCATRLARHGIVVSGSMTDIDELLRRRRRPRRNVELLVDRSPPLSEIVDVTMKWSRNGYAETLLPRPVAAGEPATGTRGLEADAARRCAALGVSPDGYLPRDGSGLSRYDYRHGGRVDAAARRRSRANPTHAERVSLDAAGRRRQRHARDAHEGHARRGPRRRPRPASLSNVRALVGLSDDARRRAAGVCDPRQQLPGRRRPRSTRSPTRRAGPPCEVCPDVRSVTTSSRVNPTPPREIVIQAYGAGLSTVRAANPDVRLRIGRDQDGPDEAVLLVEYPAPTGNPAGRDVQCDAENRDWSAGRALAFQIRPGQSLRLSVSIVDRNRVVYTAWRDLKGGVWQQVRIPFDEIRPNPFFQPPDAKTGAPLDVSDVKFLAFAPQTRRLVGSPSAGSSSRISAVANSRTASPYRRGGEVNTWPQSLSVISTVTSRLCRRCCGRYARRSSKATSWSSSATTSIADPTRAPASTRSCRFVPTFLPRSCACAVIMRTGCSRR